MPSNDHNTNLQTRHSRAARLFHAGLALAIVTQLLTSLQMHGPDDAQAGNILFQVHRYSGLAATGAVYFVQVAHGLHSAEPDGMIAMMVLLALANLVWAYLMAHGGLALQHHLLQSMRLSTMWSFGRYGLDMSLSAVELWNQNAFLAINAGAQAPAYVIAIARMLASWAIYLAMILLIFAWVRRGRAVRFALLDATCAALIGLGVAQGITVIWYHPRPFEIGLGRQLLDHASESSFPSDHATLMFSLAIPLLLSARSRHWGGALLLLGCAVAWSRIYLGVHFPLDMLGAFGVAACASFLIRMAGPRLHRLFYPLLVSTYETVLRRLGLPSTVFPRNL